MNKSHILIIASIVIIVAFSLYTFGSQSPVSKSGTKENPVRGPSSSTLSTYVDRENPGNFYSIQFPPKAVVEHGNASGSYTAVLPQGVFSVRLVDIPDNSDVPLVLLTQIQPALKSSLQVFNRVGYNQFIVGGHSNGGIAYISIVDIKNKIPIDLEDWSAEKGLYIPFIEAGQSLPLEWNVRLVKAGSYTITVLFNKDGDFASPPIASSKVFLEVVPKLNLNPGNVLPIAFGVPALIMGVLGVVSYIRGRKTGIYG